MKSKIYYKLGNWKMNLNDVQSQEETKEISSYFKKSIDLNRKSHESWHAYGMINYKVCQNKIQNESNFRPSSLDLEYIQSALKGFIKAITLRGSFKEKSL